MFSCSNIPMDADGNDDEPYFRNPRGPGHLPAVEEHLSPVEQATACESGCV